MSAIDEDCDLTNKRQALLPEDLKVMPSEWISALKKAALNCSSQEVEDLIAQIPSRYKTLVELLQELVDNDDFEIIMNLSQASFSDHSNLKRKHFPPTTCHLIPTPALGGWCKSSFEVISV